MSVLYINFSASKDVLRNLNRTKEDLEDILKNLNNARNNSNIGVYVSNLSAYTSNIDSEIRSIKSDITKIEGFYKAYENFLERAKEIDKQCAKGIKSAGYEYRKEEGLLKEEWKTFGKLVIGVLIIAGTIAAVSIAGPIAAPIAIGAAVGACVSAGIGAGVGYISGGTQGAIDGFFSGALTGAISGAIGGAFGGVPPLSGAPAKEILKYIGKQSIIDGIGSGVGEGIVGFYNNGIEGARQGITYGVISGLVTGVLSAGISSRASIGNKIKNIDLPVGFKYKEVYRVQYAGVPNSSNGIRVPSGLEFKKLSDILTYIKSNKVSGVKSGIKWVTEADILKKSGLDKLKVDEIVSIPKGSRPDPSTYLSKDYIEQHLKQFENGASYIMPKSDYDFYYRGVPEISRPDGTMFFAPKDYMDDIIKEANGDISVIEKKLGYPNGSLANGDFTIVNIKNPKYYNMHIPSGNEHGANSEWIPGGFTSGGIPEVILEHVPNDMKNIEIVFLERK